MTHPQILLRTKTNPAGADTVPTTVLTGTTFTQIIPYDAVMLSFEQATDAAPLVQLADNSTTADITIATQESGCMTIQTPITGRSTARPLYVDLYPGQEMGVYLSALTSPAATTQRINIYLKPYRKGS